MRHIIFMHLGESGKDLAGEILDLGHVNSFGVPFRIFQYFFEAAIAEFHDRVLDKSFFAVS